MLFLVVSGVLGFTPDASASACTSSNADLGLLNPTPLSFFPQGLVRDAEAKGATLCTGPFRREGNLIWPVVVDNITPDMR